MYIYFTVFMYQHDKSMQPFITQQNYKQRRRRATICFACEMYCYLMETVATVSALIRNFTEQYDMEHTFVFVQINFACMSVLEALSTSLTREAFMVHITRVFHLFTNLPGWFQRLKNALYFTP